jgi:branched-chain amino acid transport system permease protein
MLRFNRPILVFLGIAALGLAILPFVGERFHVQLTTQMMILAIFAMSLDLLVGFAGLVSLGHAAFYGLAGYSLAILTSDFGLTSMWATLPLTLACCGTAALVIGWLSIRTSGIYFIMVTLAFAQMAYYFFNDVKGFGGSDGLYVNTKPVLSVADTVILSLQNRTTLYYFVFASLLGTFLFLWVLLRSPFGRVITAIGLNEGRTRALGFATMRYKLVAFVIAGILAGLAGYLGAAQFGYVNPAHLGWRESGRVLMVVILGGSGTLFGPAIGAFVFIVMEDVLSSLTEHWLLLMGGFVIAVVLFLPNGLAGLLLRLTGKSRPRSGVITVPARLRTTKVPKGTDPILETDDLTKRFDGVIAVRSVSLRFLSGQVHAIIGPNGAGKTTLINLLSGELQASAGNIRYKGRNVTGLPPDAISRLGIGRSFQITNLFASLTCYENCWVAAQSRLPSSMRFIRAATSHADIGERAQRALVLCGLEARRDDPAAMLSHGERRKLEIAMVLATEPELFLLDEPLAGMGPQESREMVALLKVLAQDHTLILIEHDMDAVFSIADVLTVMVNGSVIASGPVAEVRANPLVQDAYLGHREAAE